MPPKLTAAEIEARDAARLNELGYKQVVMVWGWVIVAFFTMAVALAMAEISSAYPTSGGLYWWAARLSTKKYAPFASWMTGWFNLIGQFAVTAGINYGIASMLAAVISVGTNGTWVPTVGATVGLHIAMCFTQGIANSLGPKVTSAINTFSTWWQVIAPAVIMITMAVKAPTHQPASFVFTKFNNNTGWSSTAYVAVIGILQAQFTLVGYDSSAHMSEETKNAEVSGPVGMVMAVLDLDATINSDTGFPVMQIMFDSVGSIGAICLMVMLIIACWQCGFASVTANSRMIYAFSRDGAIPGHKYWHKIDVKRQTPLNAVWLSVIVASLLGLPSLGNSTAFSAITSVATIGLYISYAVPIFAKLLNRGHFVRGPLHLGRFSDIIGIISIFWISLITILFVLPPKYPVDAVNMNYACLAVGMILLGAGGRFAIDARKWFTGPKINLPQDKLDKVDLEQDRKDIRGLSSNDIEMGDSKEDSRTSLEKSDIEKEQKKEDSDIRVAEIEKVE
ncbi:hypothetical protein G6F70_001038 [Rhizopus microsporus]|nr:hypothetical protein G6F71_002205 [Rhizopus microsporus]KAG1203802.1 hypothetical protein G6F70_001038 [Rhizopus microsporus]KAG1214243.1 hypothetical protein G6F69_002077 [Rhizopus microsporus]KAG1236764.1 hypothetical protein G6F67_001711 [Rhizopus microsporus]KAG1268086.1 hypothetical protein G6F68_001417 [Rhizopus microsporus]